TGNKSASQRSPNARDVAALRSLTSQPLPRTATQRWAEQPFMSLAIGLKGPHRASTRPGAAAWASVPQCPPSGGRCARGRGAILRLVTKRAGQFGALVTLGYGVCL